MRIYKSFFRFEKCRKACKYRLYRLMRTYKEIVKNYILIYFKFDIIFGFAHSQFKRFIWKKYGLPKKGDMRRGSLLEGVVAKRLKENL